MTTPEDDTQPGLTTRQLRLLRDLAGLLLITAGLAGLVGIAFTVSRRLGLAACSTACAGAGVALAHQRQR